MTFKHSPRILWASLAFFGCLVTAPVTTSAADDDPLSPAYMSAAHKTYWMKKVMMMDTNSEGKITAEGYLKYYSDLWDKNAPAGSALPYKLIADKWAAMESQNPLDPEYKTPIWREKHVETMDTDHDGTVTKEEFLEHMKGHWLAATKLASASTLTHEQMMEMISNPLDPRWHRR